MAENSKIEWTDHTFNPWIGCTKVSPGCANCYAAVETFPRVQRAGGRELWGKGKPRHRTSEANWRKPIAWNKAAHICPNGKVPMKGAPGGHGPYSHDALGDICPECGAKLRRARVFCASMSDWLDDEVPVEWLADLLKLIHDTPNLDWQLLTKRPENYRSRMKHAIRGRCFGSDAANVKLSGLLHGGHLPNVWMGTTVENQAMADKRIPALLNIPAKVRFLSCEPLLSDVRLFGLNETLPYELAVTGQAWSESNVHYERLYQPGIHWVICGGESGTEARPMHPRWARSLRDQCKFVGIPFFFKQWGGWKPVCEGNSDEWLKPFYKPNRLAKEGEDQGALNESYGETCKIERVVIHIDGSTHDPIAPGAFLQGAGPMTTYRVGKVVAGKQLDGQVLKEFPNPRVLA